MPLEPPDEPLLDADPPEPPLLTVPPPPPHLTAPPLLPPLLPAPPLDDPPPDDATPATTCAEVGAAVHRRPIARLARNHAGWNRFMAGTPFFRDRLSISPNRRPCTKKL